MPVWTELRGINAKDLLREDDTGSFANTLLLEDGSTPIILEADATETTWTARAALSDV